MSFNRKKEEKYKNRKIKKFTKFKDFHKNRVIKEILAISKIWISSS